MKIHEFLNLQEDDIIGISWVPGYDKYTIKLKYGSSVEISGLQIYENKLEYMGDLMSRLNIPLGESPVCVCCYVDDEVTIYSINGRCDRCGSTSFDTPENIEKELGPVLTAEEKFDDER